ncbi:protein kinase domain-containing protein [Kitasatospora sp. NPDC001175]|uniref:protein kinase domain-containing protein n=1 Tax=Kitasatospora sp. NPDC001175 TaxID=3157103 RepID=UPI003CFF86C9
MTARHKKEPAVLDELSPDNRRRIGPYMTLARLGAGGMGEVFLARRPEVAGQNSLVAVKTLHPDLTRKPELRARFQREIAAVGAVSGTFLASLLACDAGAEPPWLATEFIPGPTLAEAVDAAGPLSEETVRALGVDLATALRAVHARRLLHRDIKPGNVLLSSGGPRLIDFGIAKALEGIELTTAGQVIGTPGYMSPEHLDTGTEMSSASDVFCLASVLAYASCGRGPFDGGQTESVLYRISRAEADLSGVPGGLRDVLAECLRLRAEDRPDLAQLIGLLDPGSAPYAWPSAVAALCERYEQDATRLAALPLPPFSDFSGTRPPDRAPIGKRSGRSKGTMTGLAVFGLALGVLGALLVPRLMPGHHAASPSTSASPSASASASASGKPVPTAGSSGQAATKVAQPSAMAGADAGASGDFGSAALTVSALRTNWAPWHRDLGYRLGGCALGDGLYVCSRYDGGLVALDADNGVTSWSLDPRVPLNGRLGDAAVGAPALADGIAYTTDGTYTRAVRLRDHSILWEKQAEGGQIAVSVLPVGKTLVTYLVSADSPQIGGSGTTNTSALRANAADGGQELWTTSLKSAGTTPIALDDRLYAMSDQHLVMLETQHGAVTASAPAACSVLHGNGQWVICADTGAGKVESFGAQHLDGGRMLLDSAGQYLALGRSGLLIADGMNPGAYTAVDLATGRTVWSYQLPAEQTSKATALLLAGSKVIDLTVASPGIIDLSQGTSASPKPEEGPQGWPGSRNDGGVSAGQPSAVLADGLLYAGFADGTVLSGYAPQ